MMYQFKNGSKWLRKTVRCKIYTFKHHWDGIASISKMGSTFTARGQMENQNITLFGLNFMINSDMLMVLTVSPHSEISAS